MAEFQRIAQIENEVQAQLVESALTERGIPHIMRSYYDMAYDGVFQTQRGWGHVEAPAKHREDVLGIIEAIDSSQEDEQ